MPTPRFSTSLRGARTQDSGGLIVGIITDNQPGLRRSVFIHAVGASVQADATIDAALAMGDSVLVKRTSSGWIIVGIA